MLRIAVDGSPDGETRLRLHGRLVGPWVPELRRVCAELLARAGRLRLDLTEVSFLDRGGVELVLALRDRGGVEVENCSAFVAAQLGAWRRARGPAGEGLP